MKLDLNLEFDDLECRAIAYATGQPATPEIIRQWAKHEIKQKLDDIITQKIFEGAILELPGTTIGEWGPNDR